MSTDIAFQRLRDANPVPDPAALRERPIDASVLLMATQQRSTDMQTDRESKRTQKAPALPGRRWVPALVGAAVIIVAAASALLLTKDTDLAGAPETVARSFIEALGQDNNTALALLAPDVLIDGNTAGVEEYPAELDWLRAMGWQNSVGECTTAQIGSTAEVTCFYAFENSWTRALDIGPFSGSSYSFVITDGQILELHQTIQSAAFSPLAWEVFRDWVRDTHGDVAVMYSDGCCTPILTPESIALWEQHTDEFVSYVAEFGTP